MVETISETIRKLVGVLRNPRVVYKIKLVVVIILFILALVNGNVDVVLSGITQLLLGM